MTQRPGRSTADEVTGVLRIGSDPAADDVRGSILRLAERFRPADARGIDAVWVVDITGHQPYTIHVRAGRCLISPGAIDAPAARLVTDAVTWLDIVSGRLDGVGAFQAGRLVVHGDLNLAVRLETMFTPGPAATRLLRTVHTDVKGVEIESIVAGAGTPVLLLHGLAASKVSFLPTLDGLADRHEVHALDLPGFGKSDKPAPHGKRYSAPWMADVVHGYMARNRIREAYLVGNSMGGRIAAEVALRHPRSVRGFVGLGSAVAFDQYQRFGPMIRLLRSQWLGLAPVPIRREWIEAGLRELFHDPSALPAQNLRAAAEDTMLHLRDRGYRLAVLACARHLGAERATGRNSYWGRLCDLQVPSLWIFGDRDVLVHHRYAARVTESLPHAQVEVWNNIGHVPQFEAPERTNAAVSDFIARIEAGH
ncbi:MAG: alpha/beta fold hydrolase [Actinobacteria bacterium]|nr:alpha/beta fold hydrolase [Actinomycetota bacterium]